MSENSIAKNSDANGGAESTSLTTAAEAIGGGAGTAAGTATNLAHTAHEYGERISEAAVQAKEYVAGKASVVGGKFKELQNADLSELTDTARDYARKNPGQAILISAAAGLLLGLFLRGGRR
jgi:ElaB/YqjD/DUF883 family membrane-anchored ribosome-binding protein